MDNIERIPKKEKLLPCPFCGADARLNTTNGMYWIECTSGGEEHIVETQVFETKIKAIEAWNTRSCYPAEFLEWMNLNKYIPFTFGLWSNYDRTESYTTEELYKIWRGNA